MAKLGLEPILRKSRYSAKATLSVSQMFISTKSRSAGNLLPTSLAAVRALFDNVLTIPHYELVSKLAHYPVVIGHLTLRPNPDQ